MTNGVLVVRRTMTELLNSKNAKQLQHEQKTDWVGLCKSVTNGVGLCKSVMNRLGLC
jgi:hypothetical protein